MPVRVLSRVLPTGFLILSSRRESEHQCKQDLLRAGERFPSEVEVTFSPVQPDLVPRDLAEWILADGLDACFQIQLHRAVWPDTDRGV